MFRRLLAQGEITIMFLLTLVLRSVLSASLLSRLTINMLTRRVRLGEREMLWEQNFAQTSVRVF